MGMKIFGYLGLVLGMGIWVFGYLGLVLGLGSGLDPDFNPKQKSIWVRIKNSVTYILV